MPVDPKLITLVTKLTQRTQAKELKWEQAAVADVYVVSFPQQSIVLTRGLGYLRLHVEDSSGNTLASVEDNELPGGTLGKLFDIARSQALDVDGQLDDLLGQL